MLTAATAAAVALVCTALQSPQLIVFVATVANVKYPAYSLLQALTVVTGCTLMSPHQDFEILVDEDTAPTPAPAAKAAAAAGSTPAGGYPKPPSAPPGGPPAAGRVPSSHLQYVRPGLEPQPSLGSAGAAGHQMPGQHMQQQQQGGVPGMPGMEQQRQGSLMSGLSGAASMGSQQQQQQYSLPLGVMPGQPGVPGPRPPPGACICTYASSIPICNVVEQPFCSLRCVQRPRPIGPAAQGKLGSSSARWQMRHCACVAWRQVTRGSRANTRSRLKSSMPLV
jgi:hypothetical protein